MLPATHPVERFEWHHNPWEGIASQLVLFRIHKNWRNKMHSRAHAHARARTHAHTHTHTLRFKLCRKIWTTGKSFSPQVPFPWGEGGGDKQQSRGRKKKILFYYFSWLYSSAKSLPCRGQKALDSVLKGANCKAARPFPGSRKWDHSPHLATRTRGHPSAVFQSSLPQSFEG